MSAESFLVSSYGHVGRLVLMLKGITFKPGRCLKVSLEWIDPKGTDAQRVKIRSMVRAIARHSGYDVDDLYEVLLAQKYGTRRVEVLKGCFVERPAKRVGDLDKAERSRYIEWLQDVGEKAGAW